MAENTTVKKKAVKKTENVEPETGAAETAIPKKKAAKKAANPEPVDEGYSWTSAAEELNIVMSLDPQIDTTLKPKELKKAIRGVAKLVTPEDELSTDLVEFLEANHIPLPQRKVKAEKPPKDYFTEPNKITRIVMLAVDETKKNEILATLLAEGYGKVSPATFAQYISVIRRTMQYIEHKAKVEAEKEAALAEKEAAKAARAAAKSAKAV